MEPAGVVVAEDGGESGAKGEPLAFLQIRTRQDPVINRPRYEHDSNPTFERIDQKDCDSGRSAQSAEDIGCADVAAANGSDIDPFRFGDEKAGGDGSEQIRR